MYRLYLTKGRGDRPHLADPIDSPVLPSTSPTIRALTMASRYVFPKTVKELRFHLCQTTPASQGLRYTHHTRQLS
jgi:hypothetical protein